MINKTNSVQKLDNIAVAYLDNIDSEQAKRIAKKWQFSYLGDAAAASKQAELEFLLQMNHQALELSKLDEPKLWRNKSRLC